MDPVFNIFYIFVIGFILFLSYYGNQRILFFFAWLEDMAMIGSEIINRLDRLVGVLQDLAHSFHSDYDFLSNRLFKETVDSTKKEICETILKELTTKNGKLKKKIANEIVKLSAKIKNMDKK